MFDDTWRSVVEQRMALRLDEAHEERLAHLAAPEHEGVPMRARLGRVLIVLGSLIAGAAADPGAPGRAI